MHEYERPLKVTGERVWRTWLGGRELDKLHGVATPKDGSFPEEWMFSLTTAKNIGREHIEEGLAHLADTPKRISLKQLVNQYPQEMLGAAHAAEYGTATGMLVKVLDSQVRLAIQVHPDNDAAMRLFNSRFGKTECWQIISLRQDGDEEPCLYLGFKEGVDRAKWKDCFDRQDVPGMLGMLHRIVPKPGETYIVYGGTPHAIGAGCLLVEAQEPTDYTIRMEKVMPYGLTLADEAMHQGLGFERMFECFNYVGKSERDVMSEWRLPSKMLKKTADYTLESLIDYSITTCFTMDRCTISGTLPMRSEGAFSGLYVVSGAGVIESPGGTLSIKPNDQIFIPAMCRDFSIINTGTKTDDAPLELLQFHGPQVKK